MKAVKVTILKQAGETGLRRVGSPMLLDAETAKRLANRKPPLVKLPTVPKKKKTTKKK